MARRAYARAARALASRRGALPARRYHINGGKRHWRTLKLDMAHAYKLFAAQHATHKHLPLLPRMPLNKRQNDKTRRFDQATSQKAAAAGGAAGVELTLARAARRAFFAITHRISASSFIHSPRAHMAAKIKC